MTSGVSAIDIRCGCSSSRSLNAPDKERHKALLFARKSVQEEKGEAARKNSLQHPETHDKIYKYTAVDERERRDVTTI